MIAAEVKELIGVDVGQARCGIARASSIAKLAEPLESVETDKLLKTLAKMIQDNDTEAVVIGLPRNLSGDDTAQTAWVRDWVQKAKAELTARLYWQDEALSSRKAQELAAKADKPVDEHALAAAIILQDFLDSPEADRTVC